MLPFRKRLLADDSAQTLVEFAVVSLMLVILLLGVFEFGRMMLVYTTVANASRAGARYAIVHGSDNLASTSNVQTVVKNFLSAAPLDTSRAGLLVDVTYCDDPGCTAVDAACTKPGCTVKVTTTYPYDPFIAYYSWLAINLKSTNRGVITF